MSVSFQKETVRGPAALVGNGNSNGGDTAHKIGEALTGGQSQTGYLAVSRVIKYRPVLYRRESHTRYHRRI
jgi:hypothetical protein